MSSKPRNEPRTDTRQRLLQAALSAFGRHDFDSVSVRRIVEDAGVNIAAISYHFGGKHELYLQTAEYLAESLRAGIGPSMQAIEAEIPKADVAQCRRLLSGLIGEFAETLLTGELGEHAPGFIFREQSQPSQAFDILYAKLFAPMHRTMTELVSRVRGLPADGDEARMVAHGLLGQVIAFRAARTTLLRHLSRPAYTRADLRRIKDLVSAMTTAALDYQSPDEPL